MREWAAKQDVLHTYIKLSGIARDLKFDVICQVSYILSTFSFTVFFFKVVSIGIDESNRRAYLGVWDGTKASV